VRPCSRAARFRSIPGATASATLVNSGGTLLDAGVASGMIISGGGAYLQAGGVSVSATVRGGGADVVQSGGTTTGTALNGGSEMVSAAGVTLSAHVNSGGFEMVASGGTASAAIISGGTLDVMSGASIGSGPVTFAVSGGGTLQLDSSLTFSGLVAGFGQPDLLYLKDLSFVSASTSATWTQSGTSGTLAVTNGTQTADILLLGQYSTANFHVSSSTAGGTIVTDPPVVTQTDLQPEGLVNPHTV
jgi:autotransporter passenger strand-loop-strand repeat protein